MTAPDARAPQFQIYRVGGSVRDELLGLPAGDRDWVVVGATPEQMLAQGFQAVGKDFPVFLHPQSHEEYALARTERKTAPGYKGFAVHFSPDVTLEDDLLRRDLTINAIARAADGSLVDPFHGQADIQARIFRHVSPAFREDPVRILRLARFAARFPDFTIAPGTLALMREMTAAGEVHALVAERVWQELSRGLMSQRPSRMLQVLDQAHALRILLPHLPAPDTQPDWLTALDASAAAHDPLPVRFAILMAGMTIPEEPCIELGPKMVTSVTEQAKALRASNECTDAATRLVSEIPGPVPQAARRWFLSPDHQNAETLLALFNRHDAWRRPERLRLLLTVAQRLALPDHPVQIAEADQAISLMPESDSTQPVRPGQGYRPSSPATVNGASGTISQDSVSNIIHRIEQALSVAAAVDTGAIARQHQANPGAIRAAIDDARREAISGYLVSRS
ncbi:multifunctional CCA tRNA nucleotidyl transferase/2'3'-cyclic phosphodiesterase/2'nucleotidase/phosphatase [Lautropia mirabilis]|uniref:multifunctional CCA tRNA nucleotidyl transferase/2'3'-cyclic phosphodiesterase/2'nucleotidase/phosphatase n=1 Tax=Lautropia mirabilis TaxID=47671 RepID=UPI00234A9B3E|nr:multifunctional CCA tRNA nucleotidyl transferase/2'3'-cyclic phosphodiesterase/2'nucleotidase/phosphatase [Lautropia mirabilis]MDC6094269.1 multifunctional CCA tRNA nucleotidyl transferase/2'3'-cyclic phosphodiesterase/2'nucleotidase/phosphatase [Lautropia mirabilis]